MTLKPGSSLTFRIPADAAEDEIAVIESVRSGNRPRHEGYLSRFFWTHVREQISGTQGICIPLPDGLTPRQWELLHNPDIQRMLGYWIAQSVQRDTDSPILDPPNPSSVLNQTDTGAEPLKELMRGVYGKK